MKCGLAMKTSGEGINPTTLTFTVLYSLINKELDFCPSGVVVSRPSSNVRGPTGDGEGT